MPGPEDARTQASGDSVDARVLVIELARIQPYEHNPRHGRNPEYDRIKDSIRTQGLDQPLVIVVDGVKALLFAAAGKWRFETASALPEVRPSDIATS